MAKYFSSEEVEGLNPALVEKLDLARDVAGVPFVLTSTFRQGDRRSHGRGFAVDIRANMSRARFRIVLGLIQAGFRRIGVYDKHVHADIDPELPKDVMWVGEST